ncbi:MAG: hypothetical protein ACPL1D_00685 [Microgenomates group bacterium]
MKNNLKEKAIKFRKKGLSYSEILKKIPVAKSTLSLWLRSVGLSKKQKQRLTKKRLEAMRRGWKTIRKKRINKKKDIIKKAKLEIDKIKIDNQKLLLLGAMLYWAEGSKQKNNSISQGVIFSNSDFQMVNLFIKWLKKCLKVDDERIKFEIYIHINYKPRIKEIINYWSKITGYPKKKFDKIYYKKHNLSITRMNQYENYYGLVRVKVRKSADLNRKITGWIKEICKKCGVV